VLLIGLPIWLAIAAAVKLSSRGPVFYATVASASASRSSGC